MAEVSKIRCIFDLRDAPPSAFLLPGEKESNRQWRHNCEHRWILLNYLATFADADGGNVRPAVDRMAARHEVSRRTIFYYLDDLKTLGFINNGKLTGFKGTRNRSINVAAVLKAVSVVQSSLPPVVQSSPLVVQSSQEQPCSLRPSVVQSSLPPVQGEDCTQPSLHTVQPTALPTGPEHGGWDGWINKLPEEMHGAIANTPQRLAIEKQIEQHGSEIVAAAIRRWVEIRDMDVAGIKRSKWAVWLEEGGVHLQWVIQQKLEEEALQRNRATTDAYVRQQQDAHAKFMEYDHPLRHAGEDPEQAMAAMRDSEEMKTLYGGENKPARAPVAEEDPADYIS
ncbi:MAG: hypothetical protein WA182_12005 [Candidatus Sulfotelmatobacter sp.]